MRLHIVCLTLAACLVCTGAARAAGVTEFSHGISYGAAPVAITAGADGNLWFTEHGTGTAARITPSGAVTEFALGTALASLQRIVAGPDGNLWFSQIDPDAIGRITPDGHVTKFPLAAGTYPVDITRGPDGAIWFAEYHAIGRITSTGVITEYPISATNVAVWGLENGPDGNLWFLRSDDKLGHMSPDGHVSSALISLSAGAQPDNLVTGPDGNLWVTERGLGKIARVTPTGDVREFDDNMLPGAQPHYIAVGADRNLWFTDGAGRVGRITPTGQIDEYNLGTDTYPYGIAAGADGGLWVAEAGVDRIARVALALPPSAATAGATAVGASWTLSGTVNPLGATATAGFEYGPTTDYGTTVSTPSVAPAGRGVAVSATIAGLAPGTTYHYRVRATSSYGSAVGADRTFTTAPAPAEPISTPPVAAAPAPAPRARDVTAPRLRALKLARRGSGRATLRFTLSEPARMTLAIARVGRVRTLAAHAGRGRIAFSVRDLRPGRYRLTVTAVDATGNRSRPASLSLRIR